MFFFCYPCRSAVLSHFFVAICYPGLPEVSYDVRGRLHSAMFKNMPDLTDREVCRLLTALDTMEPVSEFDREVFVQKMSDVDMASRVSSSLPKSRFYLEFHTLDRLVSVVLRETRLPMGSSA